MYITQIALQNFRNHTLYEAILHPNINIFSGDNGQGKTALLEALSLGLTGKSFRQGQSWIQQNKEKSRIFLELKSEYGLSQIQMILSREEANVLKFNGKRTQNYPFESFCVFCTPEDLSVIRGSAVCRRKLMDELVQSYKPQIYRKFYKILAQKNRFLKLCRQGHYNSLDQKNYFHSLQEIFTQSACDLIQARFVVLEKILPYWRHRGAAFLQTQDFSLEYLSRKEKTVFSLEEAFEDLKKEMKEKAVLERLRGCSLAGPHRHDLRFLCYKLPARESLSQGQQKALLLSWKMAQRDQILDENEEKPCLFFDDIFSEIDQHFRKNLVEFLLENQTQSFIATPVWKEALAERQGLLFNLGKRNIYDGRKNLL